MVNNSSMLGTWRDVSAAVVKVLARAAVVRMRKNNILRIVPPKG
jgi:hypothetical protein